MRTCLLLIMVLFTGSYLYAQKLTLKEADRTIKEPYTDGKEKTDTFDIEMIKAGFPDSLTLKADPIQIDKASTYPSEKMKLLTTAIPVLAKKNVIRVAITTDVFSDQRKYIILNVNYENIKDSIKKQLSDTIFIENVYPFRSSTPKEYTDWNDGKRAEIFIGTNFDFFGETLLTDWYGGVSVFLPGITDFRYHKDKSNSDPRWGINGGLYHNKSFSNFGNALPRDRQDVFSRVMQQYADTVNGTSRPVVDMRYDTLNVKTKVEMNNWGAYAGVMFQVSKFISNDDKFVTNVFLGTHFELIRRTISVTYTFDTIGSTTRKIPYDTIRHLKFQPRDHRQIYYDGYIGFNLPIQFLWKDVLDFKLIPCFGIGSTGLPAPQRNTVSAFYLTNFDLLARIGGLRLNIGGEIRGYFPNYSPVFSAYLGTSFSVAKLADFIGGK